MTIIEFINNTIVYFEKIGIDNARYNVECILEQILKCRRVDLYLNANSLLQKKELDLINEMVDKIAGRVPLCYVLGYACFLDWKFKVTPQVLIPRPETELIVEHAINLVDKNNLDRLHILDIGTGSGCIAISLAKLIKNSNIIAIDNSEEALKIAEENAGLLNVKDNIKFIHFDIMKHSISSIGINFNIIVSNPPYIKRDELNLLPEEVKYEPLNALDGGIDGLDFYKKILDNIKDCLINNGYLVLEIGYNQGEQLIYLIRNKYPDSEISLYKDYQKCDRVIVAKIRHK